MKNYYTDVVRYWFRFYVNNKHGVDFNKSKSKANWNLCKSIYSEYTEIEKKFIDEVYRNGVNTGYIVDRFSNIHDIKPNRLWKIINEIEKKFADKKEI